MKSMKKFLMVLLGAALVLSMAGAVAAASENKQLELTLEVKDLYDFTIPAAVTLTFDPTTGAGTGNAKLSANATYLPANNCVLIKVPATTNGWNLSTTGSTSKLGYKIDYSFDNPTTGETTPITGTLASTGVTAVTTVLAAEMGTRGTPMKSESSLTFTAVPDERYTASGTYTDTITFSVELGTYAAPAGGA